MHASLALRSSNGQENFKNPKLCLFREFMNATESPYNQVDIADRMGKTH